MDVYISGNCNHSIFNQPIGAILSGACLRAPETACVCFVVFFSTYIAYICIMTGQKQLRPTLVGMYNYFQPIVATGVAFYLGLETFSLWKALAVALIFTGVYLVAISKAKILSCLQPTLFYDTVAIGVQQL